jgi:hypothetical protein
VNTSENLEHPPGNAYGNSFFYKRIFLGAILYGGYNRVFVEGVGHFVRRERPEVVADLLSGLHQVM